MGYRAHLSRLPFDDPLVAPCTSFDRPPRTVKTPHQGAKRILLAFETPHSGMCTHNGDDNLYICYVTG
jgi:hypothetical protein